MATYNRAQFIEETLQSLQKQTFLYCIFLILDDSNTDSTKGRITPLILNI